MSVGHRKEEGKRTRAELYAVLSAGDTPKLLARPVKVDTMHDIPYGGGNSVDGRTVYVDRRLYREIMDGKTAVRGMTGRQICNAIIEHEHIEWSVDAGDNPIDVYPAAHALASVGEDQIVDDMSIDPARYNACLRPALEACARRPPQQPPRDLWCGPYLDEGDRDILRALRAKDVEDASKASKIEARYGYGVKKCKDCEHFGIGLRSFGGGLASCALVSGPVRDTRQCRWWEKK